MDRPEAPGSRAEDHGAFTPTSAFRSRTSSRRARSASWTRSTASIPGAASSSRRSTIFHRPAAAPARSRRSGSVRPGGGFRVEFAEPASRARCAGRSARRRRPRGCALAGAAAGEGDAAAVVDPAGGHQRLGDLTRPRQSLRHDRARWAQRLHALLAHEGWPARAARCSRRRGTAWPWCGASTSRPVRSSPTTARTRTTTSSSRAAAPQTSSATARLPSTPTA
jgi:hypothetical protein